MMIRKAPPTGKVARLQKFTAQNLWRTLFLSDDRWQPHDPRTGYITLIMYLAGTKIMINQSNTSRNNKQNYLTATTFGTRNRTRIVQWNIRTLREVR